MKLCRVVLAISLLTAGAAATAANVLVVRSTGPSAKLYPPGKSLPSGGKISLKANDQLVVLDGRGTRILRGPGLIDPSAPLQAAPRGPAIASLVTGGQQRRARIGANRPVLPKPRPANFWQIDVAKSSTICLPGTGNVTLWRADATNPVTLTISDARGATQTVEWAAGRPTVGWPSGLAISEGGDYRLSWNGAPAPTTIRFKTLAATPTGVEDTATAFIANKCDAQLDLLIESAKEIPAQPSN